jgi:hypothetical protein
VLSVLRARRLHSSLSIADGGLFPWWLLLPYLSDARHALTKHLGPDAQQLSMFQPPAHGCFWLDSAAEAPPYTYDALWIPMHIPGWIAIKLYNIND